MISEWRSITPVKINQYDITIATHYDITMGNDVARDIHCNVTMNNDVVMCAYHDITMHNDIAINLYYIFSAQCLIMILVWVVWKKTKTS